jgi:hypothetical protein
MITDLQYLLLVNIIMVFKKTANPTPNWQVSVSAMLALFITGNEKSPAWDSLQKHFSMVKTNFVGLGFKT